MKFLTRLFKNIFADDNNSSNENDNIVKQTFVYTQEDEEEMCFEDEYEKKLSRLYDRIYDILPDYSTNISADKYVEAYKKAFSRFDELEAFCAEKGDVGKRYFKKNYEDDKKGLINELNDFMKNDYQELKQWEQEELEYEKHYNSIKKQIIKIISSSSNGFLQKNLYSNFSEDDKSLVIKILNKLTSDGKITKQKQGNSNLLKIIK